MHAADLGCGRGFASLGLARMVGENGRVISVDLQPKILDALIKRAKKAGLAGRIQPRLCDPDSLHLNEPVDFALAFYMAHELPNAYFFFKQVRKCLKQGGTLLLVEPVLHVSRKSFEETLHAAEKAGFKTGEWPRIALSRAAVLR